MLNTILIHAHSGLRWVVLLLLVYVMINAVTALRSKRTYTSRDKRLSLFAMTSVHIQVILGLVLYFLSSDVKFADYTMTNDQVRFFTIEHAFGMLIAVTLVTLGHRKGKSGNFKGLFWYYTIALLIILISIPWPFRGFGNGWF